MNRRPIQPPDRVAVGLSGAADHGRLWIAAAGALAVPGGRSRRAAARGLASLAVSSFLANVVVKSLLRRARPGVGPGSLTHLVRTPRTSSFPSGHSASAAAFATGAALEAPVLGPPLAILALGVGWSRVRVGVHRPVEVLAGAVLGLTVALIGYRSVPARHSTSSTAASSLSLPSW